METIIESSLWDIYFKKPLRRCVLKYDGEKMTRHLFVLSDTKERNNTIDVIDYLPLSFKEINSMSSLEIGIHLKKTLKKCYKNNVDKEIKFFKHPIITINK